MDPNEPNSAPIASCVRALLIMTAGSFAFGWALVPLYECFAAPTGIGNAEAKDGKAVVREALDPNREVTIEFVASPASVGSFEFRPKVGVDADSSRQSSTTPNFMPRI